MPRSEHVWHCLSRLATITMNHSTVAAASTTALRRGLGLSSRYLSASSSSEITDYHNTTDAQRLATARDGENHHPLTPRNLATIQRLKTNIHAQAQVSTYIQPLTSGHYGSTKSTVKPWPNSSCTCSCNTTPSSLSNPSYPPTVRPTTPKVTFSSANSRATCHPCMPVPPPLSSLH